MMKRLVCVYFLCQQILLIHCKLSKKEEWQEREYFTQMSNLSSVMVHGSPGQVKVKVIDDLRCKHCGK